MSNIELTMPTVAEVNSARRKQLVWTIGDRMRKCLEESTWGVQEVASYYGVGRNTIGNWLADRTLPDAHKIRLWAFSFRVPVSYLLVGDWPDGTGPEEGGFEFLNELKRAAGAPVFKESNDEEINSQLQINYWLFANEISIPDSPSELIEAWEVNAR